MDGRRVRLVLVDAGGDVRGALPAFDVGTPWWPDVEPVVEVAWSRFGVRLAVLRLVRATTPSAEMGGPVTYVAEVLDGRSPRRALELPTADEVRAATGDDPLRAPWARPGGVAAQVAWADGVLARAGRIRTGPAVQVKSWNLSSVLRLPTADGPVWCKAIPAAVGDEGPPLALVARVEPSLVPALLGHDPASRTVLVADVPGVDQVDAGADVVGRMVDLLVDLTVQWAGREDGLIAAGLADLRTPALLDQAVTFAARADVRARFAREEVAALERLVTDDLPHRLSDLVACGLPDVLVHGDPRPLNWRDGPDGLRLLDWGEAGVGHPVHDGEPLTGNSGPEVGDRARERWRAAWLRHRPGSDPDRAAALARPVIALSGALLYQRFLDGIEANEHPYHAEDVLLGVRGALAAAAEAPLG